MKHSITHEFLFSNPKLSDIRDFIESTANLSGELRVAIAADDDQRDGNFGKLTVRENEEAR